MIEDIQLPEPIAKLTDEDLTTISNEVEKTYPYPLALSFQIQKQAIDHQSQTGILLKDNLSTVLQYLALLALWDYAQSEVPRDFKVYSAVEQMVFRPGPGKWLGFLRSLMTYYTSEEISRDFAITGMMDFLKTFAGPKGLKIRLTESGKSKSQTVLDTLVNLRNRWVHSKSWNDDQIRVVTGVLSKIMSYIYRDLSFIRKTELSVRDSDGKELALVGTTLPDNLKKIQTSEICLKFASRSEPLMRLMMQWNDAEKVDILLLEEIIQQKQVLYSSSFNSCRFSRTDPSHGSNVTEAISILDHVHSESPILKLKDLTLEKLAYRCNEHTRSVISDFESCGKYDPIFYSPSEGTVKVIDDFIEDTAHPVLLLSGEQGCGKSSLLAYWASKTINTIDNSSASGSKMRSAVFMLEAHTLPPMAGTLGTPKLLIDEALRKELLLETGSNFQNYLSKIAQEKIKSERNQKVIFLFDAINEYEGKDKPEQERRDLILELPNYARELEAIFGQGKVKMILSLRWNLFKVEGYGETEFVSDRSFRTGTFFGARIEDAKASIEVPELSSEQAETVYEKIRNAGIGMSPYIPWDELDPSIKKLCFNPMMMQLFMRAYDGKTGETIRVRNANQLKKQFLSELFIQDKKDNEATRKAKKARSELVLNILQAMRERRTPYLPLDPLEGPKKVKKQREKPSPMEAVFAASGERARMAEKGAVANAPYQELLERKVLREDMVRFMDKEVPHKRISFNHEIISHLLNVESKNLEKRSGLKASIIESLFFVALTLLLSSILAVNGQWVMAVQLSTISLQIISLLFLTGFIFAKMAVYSDKIIERWFGPQELLSQYLDFDCLESSITTLHKLLVVISIAVLFLISWKTLRLFQHELLINDLLRVLALSVILIVGICAFAFSLNKSCLYIYRQAKGLLRSSCRGRGAANILLDGIVKFGVFYIAILYIVYPLIFIFDKAGLILEDAGLPGINNILGDNIFRTFPWLNASNILIAVTFLFVLLLLSNIGGYWPLYLKMRRQDRLGKKWPEDPGKFQARFKRLFWVTLIGLNAVVAIGLGCAYNTSYFDFGGEVYSLKELHKRGLSGDMERFIVKLSDEERNKITSLKPMENFPKLRFIMIINAAIRDISPLAKLEGIKELWLMECDVSSLSPLVKYSRLETLALSGTPVVDIRPLENCRNLEQLLLDRTKVNMLEGLASLPKLKYLGLNETPVYDLKGLSHAPSLISLLLKKTNVRDVSPLAEIHSLCHLNLSETRVKDISALSELSNLSSLNLSKSRFRDLTQLASFESLTELDVSSCDIQDFTPLSDLHGLKVLDLSETALNNLSPLAELARAQVSGENKLDTLDLSKTKVFDLTPLAEIKSLGGLDISYTRVTDITPLKDLGNLRWIKIIGCPIRDTLVLDDMKKLLIYR